VRDQRLSVPARIGCAAVALLVGYVALDVGISGELRAKGGGIMILPLTWRVVVTAILAALTLGMGWVAVTGRE
jgi:hypothetical protein